jgi:acyl-CoA synthetase (AMP-forming)/AMP-acid ligase II
MIEGDRCLKEDLLEGGENVFPSEVEGFLMKMPGVRDVAVIGVPDERLGEEVRRFFF